MALTDDQLAALETTHGRIARLKGMPYKKVSGEVVPGWEIVLRKAKRAEYKRYRSQVHNEQLKADAQEVLVRQCCVYPSPEAFDALIDEYPGIPEAATEAIKALVSLSVDESEKF